MKLIAKVLLVLAACTCATLAPAQSFMLTNLWKAAITDPNYYSFLTNDNAHRGLAYSSETGHLLVASRTGGNRIFILDSESGAVLGQLQGMSYLSGGLYAINLIGTADDGAVFAANLTDDPAAGTKPLKLYRWASEDATRPVVVYSGDPFDGWSAGGNVRRLGDTLAVRGSGMATEVLMAAHSGTNVVWLRPRDSVTNFSATVVPTDATAGHLKHGLAWAAGNAFWTKAASAPLRRLSLTESNTAVTVASSSSFSVTATGLGFDAANNLLAIVNYSAHNVVVYQVNNLATPVPIGTNTFVTANGNINAATAAVFGGGKVFALDCNNGLVASRLVSLTTPPRIITQPTGGQILETGAFTFGVAVGGTAPLVYQWYKDGSPLPEATASAFAITNAATNHSGGYHVVVTNTYGAATSSVATLTVRPVVRSTALTLLWSQAPNSQPWLTTTDTQRGMALNKATMNVVLVSRAGSTSVAVLDGGTGALVRYLDLTGVAGGYYALNMIGVADDGAIYACNLALNSTDLNAPFKIYRWLDESAGVTPTVVYSGDPGGWRWGDTLAVRGSGYGTEILAASRNSNIVAVFTTTDYDLFTATTVVVTNAPNTAFGLGLAWGDGATFWGKTSGGNLYKVAYDLSTGTGSAVLNFPAAQFLLTASPLAVDVADNFLATVSIENPDNLRLYDLLGVGPTNPPVWIDTEFFPTDNANGNGTGAADFGFGRLYALDSNNGLMAFTVQRPVPPPTLTYSRATNVLQLKYTGTLYSATNVTGPWDPVDGAGNPHSVDLTTEPKRFFRAQQ